MTDLNRHKFLLVQLLKDIYSDLGLSACLGFKGGTALMLFHDLPRFSVDLDFNLLCPGKEEEIYSKIKGIINRYGTIFDEASKFHGQLVVLNYGAGERKLKIEISNSQFDDHYEMREFLGISVRVMTKPDMFAHKLCALLDRRSMAGRDLFDCWFFMVNRTPLNRDIIESRMKMSLAMYLQKCIDRLESVTDGALLREMGELTDKEMKTFIRTKLRRETIGLMELYREFPIYS
jgi:predicted nucleotidyltransferase component of viral defense system